jgi:hypothetical protein
MYFLLSTLQAYLPLVHKEYIYELEDIVVITTNIDWAFFGACAPRLADDRHSVDACV